MRTGFNGLDKAIGGFEKGKLYILGGRPGMGKTSLAIDIARSCEGTVLYIALDPFPQVHKGRISGYDIWLAEHCDESKFYGGKRGPLSFGDIDKIREQIMPQKTDIGLVIVDYIQLLKTKTPISDLKKMAQELDLPLLALSQLSRSVYRSKKTDYRPDYTDLRGFNKEQAYIADKVLLLYRDNYYGFNKFPAHIAELKICGERTVILRQEVKDDGIYFFDYSDHKSSDFDNVEDYAKVLAKLLEGNLARCTKEELDYIDERLLRLYTSNIKNTFVTEVYVRGLVSRLWLKNAADAACVVNSIRRVFETHHDNKSIAEDYVLGLMILTQKQFSESDGNEYMETFAALLNFPSKAYRRGVVRFFIRNAFCCDCDGNGSFLFKRFDELAKQSMRNKKIAEVVAKGLACLSAQVGNLPELKMIIERLEKLNDKYPANISVASDYAEGLHYLGENQQEFSIERQQTIERLEELAKKYAGRGAVACWAPSFEFEKEMCYE